MGGDTSAGGSAATDPCAPGVEPRLPVGAGAVSPDLQASSYDFEQILR